MLYIVLSLFLCLVQAQASGSELCSDDALQEARVFIDSEDVGDGKWQSQVVVERESDKNATADTASGRLLTDVQHNIADCGDTTKLRVVISFTVSDKASVQVPVTPPNSHLLTSLKPLPPGYELVPRFGAYKLYTIGKTFSDARAVCQTDGGHLLIINSDAELTAVQTLAVNYPKFQATNTNWFWTGVYENGTDGKYVTVEGKPFSSTGYAKLYRPDVHTNRNDGYLIARRNRGFADGKTNLAWAFMCEIDL